MWGICEGSIDEKLLKPLGLVCYGGGSRNGETTYNVTSLKGNFRYEFTQKEFDNLLEQEQIQVYLRQNKIKKLKNHDRFQRS